MEWPRDQWTKGDWEAFHGYLDSALATFLVDTGEGSPPSGWWLKNTTLAEFLLWVAAKAGKLSVAASDVRAAKEDTGPVLELVTKAGRTHEVVYNANLAHKCVRCGKAYPRMFRTVTGDVTCRQSVGCRPNREGTV